MFSNMNQVDSNSVNSFELTTTHINSANGSIRVPNCESKSNSASLVSNRPYSTEFVPTRSSSYWTPLWLTQQAKFKKKGKKNELLNPTIVLPWRTLILPHNLTKNARINGNVQKRMAFPLSFLLAFPLSFIFILLLKFLTKPFNCFMMFESGSNLIRLHMENVEFHIPFKIQQT
jgi:hypothetical protein